MATSSTAYPDEERLFEVLEKLQPNFKKPSKHGSSMGPDVSLSSMRYIDLTILRFMFIGAIFLAISIGPDVSLSSIRYTDLTILRDVY